MRKSNSELYQIPYTPNEILKPHELLSISNFKITYKNHIFAIKIFSRQNSLVDLYKKKLEDEYNGLYKKIYKISKVEYLLQHLAEETNFYLDSISLIMSRKFDYVVKLLRLKDVDNKRPKLPLPICASCFNEDLN